MNVGCSVGRSMINLLCFADAYMVLIAPSWNGLQLLIDTLYILADEINMSFNTSKTVCRLWCLIHQFLERLWVVTFLFSLSVEKHGIEIC